MTDDQGNRVFYPWGKWSKGYVAPSPDFESRVNRTLLIFNLTYGALIFATALAQYYMYAPLLLLPAILTYWFLVRRLVSGLNISSYGFDSKRYEKTYSKTISSQRFALLILCDLGLLAFGGSILVQGSLAGMPLFLLSLFFGFRLFVLWKKKREQ